MGEQSYGREVTLQDDSALQFAGAAWNSFVRTLLQVSSENRALSADPRLALTQLLSSDLWALEEGNNLLLVTRYFVLPCTLKEQNGGYCLLVHSCRPTTDGDAVNAFREGALVKANWVVLMPEESTCGGNGAAELYQRFFPNEKISPVLVTPRIEKAAPAPEPVAAAPKAPIPVKEDPVPVPVLAAAPMPEVTLPVLDAIPAPIPAPPPVVQPAPQILPEVAAEPIPAPALKPAIEPYVPPVPAKTPAVAETAGPAPAAEIESIPPFRADSSFEAESAPSGDGLVSFKVSGGYTLEGALPQDQVDQLLKKAPSFQPKVTPEVPPAPDPLPEMLAGRTSMAPPPPSTSNRMGGSFTESTGTVSLSQGSIDALLSRMNVTEGPPPGGASGMPGPAAPAAARIPEMVAAAPRRIPDAIAIDRGVGPAAREAAVSAPPLAGAAVPAAAMASPKAVKSDEIPEQMTQAQIDALLKQISGN